MMTTTTTILIICSLVTGVAAASGILIRAVKSVKTALTREVNTKLDAIRADVDEVRRAGELSRQRMELLHLLDHNRSYVSAIFAAADRYKELGGNGYVEKLVEEWKSDLHLIKGSEEHEN